MAYKFNKVVIRTNNSPEGIAKTAELWGNIVTGKIPLLFDSEHNFLAGISPISCYSNYESDEKGDFNLSILGVTSDFFGVLEKETAQGKYKKYEEIGESLPECAEKAWAKVWADQNSGVINRAFTADYESTVPAEYTKDGKPHCYLYIAVVK